MSKTIALNVAAFIISAIAVLSTPLAFAQAQDKNQHADAWQLLRSNSAVILMRHALAPGTGDPTEFELNNCPTQRNLSNQGRAQARAVGDVLRANGIDKVTLLSSQWCRCMETAQLLNVGDVQPFPVINSFFQDRSTAQQQTQALTTALSQWLEQADEVRVLVTHQVNISALTGQYASSGDMLIVSMENGAPTVLATIQTD